MTKLTISEKTYKKLQILEYSDDVSDALCTEMSTHKGIDWIDYKSIANIVYSVVLGGEVEIEEGSPVDELMNAILYCAYGQATIRVAKVFGYKNLEAFRETIDEFLDQADPDQQYPIPRDEFMARYKELAIAYGEEND
jgi:hypothetical protein